MAARKESKWGIGLGIAGAALFVAFVLTRIFVYEPFRIPSGSMMPTFKVGDFILVYKWPYGRYGSFGKDIEIDALKSAKPKRGEIFVFDFPLNPEISYMKRVVGLPGDHIRFDGHDLSVNGLPAVRDQLNVYNYSKQNLSTIMGHEYQEKIDVASYKILLFDGVAPDYLKSGEVVVPPGHYFMMGDNRDDAYDSRYWGFVPEANLIGKVVRIFMSADQERIGPVQP